MLSGEHLLEYLLCQVPRGTGPAIGGGETVRRTTEKDLVAGVLATEIAAV